MDLALADEVVEGLQGLLERGLVVEPVGLEQVDVVGLQSLERCVQRLHDVLARQAAVVGVRAGRPVDLGEDLDGVARHPLEGPAEHRLRLPQRVDVCGVERGDPHVEGGLHARPSGLLLNLAPVRDPVAVREGGDEHARAAEVAVVHAPERNRVLLRSSRGRRGDAARAPGARPAAGGDLLARHDVGRPGWPAREPHPQPGRGAVRRRALRDARPAPTGPAARAPRDHRACRARRSHAPRRATASWRSSGWRRN